MDSDFSPVYLKVVAQLFGFDACSMGNLESLLVFEGLSRYYIASEELEPGHGWNWEYLKMLHTNPDASGLELARKIIDTFVAYKSCPYVPPYVCTDAENEHQKGKTLAVSC